MQEEWHCNERKCTFVLLACDLLLLDLDIGDNDQPCVAVASSLHIPLPLCQPPIAVALRLSIAFHHCPVAVALLIPLAPSIACRRRAVRRRRAAAAATPLPCCPRRHTVALPPPPLPPRHR